MYLFTPLNFGPLIFVHPRTKIKGGPKFKLYRFIEADYTLVEQVIRNQYQRMTLEPAGAMLCIFPCS